MDVEEDYVIVQKTKHPTLTDEEFDIRLKYALSDEGLEKSRKRACSNCHGKFLGQMSDEAWEGCQPCFKAASMCWQDSPLVAFWQDRPSVACSRFVDLGEVD